MRRGWAPVNLGDVVELQAGFAFKSSQYCESDVGVRLLRGDNVVQRDIRWEGAKFWPTELIKDFAQYRLNAGDVVLAMDRPWIEAGLKAAVIRPTDAPALLVQRVARLRTSGPVDQAFLPWVIFAPEFTSYVRSIQTGSVVPHISGGQIRDYGFRLPPLSEQRRIAVVLGALEDLIEVNMGLVHNFVRAAGLVAVSLQSDQGARPLTFGDVADVSGGGTPKTSEASYWDGGIPWATPTDLTALPAPYLFNTKRLITDAGLKACASRLNPVGSILMTSRATIGAFALPQLPVAVNQGFIVVRPQAEPDLYFLFHEMKRRVPDFIARANGSTFLELSRGSFKAMSVEWPSERSRAALADRVRPLHAAAASLLVEVQDAISARDELLPLLLSGAIRVEEVAA